MAKRRKSYGTYKHDSDKVAGRYFAPSHGKRGPRKLNVEIRLDRSGNGYFARACVRGSSVISKRGVKDRCGATEVGSGPTEAVKYALQSLTKKLK